MLTVLLRTAVIYFAAVFSLRFMGKRQVGEMQLSELTTAVLLSELLAAPAANPDIPLLYGIIPLCALVSLEVLISFGVNKISFFQKIFDNRPSFIIKDGTLCQKELSKLRFGVNELVSELRLKDVYDIQSVDCAILEPGGKLSVFPASDTLPKFAVLCDGKFCPEAMEAIGTNKEKIKAFLSKKGLEAKGIFLMCMDKNGQSYIVKRGEGK